MHSYTGPSGRTYHHEAHGSTQDVVHFAATPDGDPLEIEMPMEDILFLAANLIRSQRIEALENAEPLDILRGMVR